MRKLILAAALCAGLGACSDAADQAPPAETATATETAAPASKWAGTYEYEMDGKAVTSTLMADGTYSDVQDGKETEKGLWEERDGKVCFDPEGDDTPGQCFATTEPDAEGMFTATGDDGTVLKIKKTA